MGKTTVEVQETKTVEEELVICDDCSREVDEDGMEFSNSITKDGTTSSIELHFCSKCLSEMSEDVDPPHIERAKEWLGGYWKEDKIGSDGEPKTVTYSIKSRAIDAEEETNLWASIGFILGVALLGATYLAPMAIPVWVYSLYGFGGLVTSICANGSAEKVVKAIEKVEDEIDS